MEEMGMTDLQFKSWLKQLIRGLEEVQKTHRQKRKLIRNWNAC